VAHTFKGRIKIKPAYVSKNIIIMTLNIKLNKSLKVEETHVTLAMVTSLMGNLPSNKLCERKPWFIFVL